MSRFSPHQIRSVHLELTTRCNALCPMCARTGKGAVHENLVMSELSIDDIKAIFPDAVLSFIRNIDLCGAFGDPLVARDLDDILIYLRRDPTRAVDIYTNGSLRPKEWWQNLPKLLGNESKVCFGIDGLADTNGLYRVGTKFSTIMENAAAFISGGGRAQWDFLVFRHNQHQVEAGRRLSQEMGFENFSTKVSSRFFRSYHAETPDQSESLRTAAFQVFRGDGTYAYDLEPPNDPAFSNPSHARMQGLIATQGSLRPSFDQSEIKCLSLARESIFISAEGTVFPCCWTYIASKNASVFKMKQAEDLQIGCLLDAHGGPDAINAKHHRLEEIIAGPLFEALGESWTAPNLAQGKPKVCAQTCGSSSPLDAYADPRLSPYVKSIEPMPG